MIQVKESSAKTLFPNGLAWNRRSITANKNRWEVVVEEEVIEEFKTKTAEYTIDEHFLKNYTKDLIAFRKLRDLAVRVKWEILRGVGFVHLSGLNRPDISDAELRLFYLILGLEMGELSERYGRLYDVKDRGLDHTKQSIPVSQTKASTSFHTDSTAANSFPDIIGLLCIRPAKEGGESLLVSALEVHERMRSECPELLEALYKDFVRDYTGSFI